ncbi:TRAF-like family protein [Corchorus olitorius]|uniref:TRAF-like family protein n=1 Tax=Corchorus olitorius TaxID=93759 RepID=A0A1R3KPZ0_9ROSI|nr:TRAF-like family protein [Corchorus olitorius]
MDRFREWGLIGPADTDEIVRITRDNRPDHFTLKIESYSMLCKAGENYESSIFEIGGYKWRLCFYPKGNKKRGGEGHISLYLKLVVTSTLPYNWEINATFKFFVYDQLRDNYLIIEERGESTRRFGETKSEWGLAKLLSLEAFKDVSKGYLVDDCCILGAEVFVSKHAGRVECLSFINNPYDNIFTWEIENFSTLDDVFYESKHFIVEGNTWKIGIYPKGFNSEANGGLSALLILVNGGQEYDKKVYAEYKLMVKDKLGDNLLEHAAKYWFSTSEDSLGWPNFIELKDLEGLVEDDRLILEAEIVVTSATKNLP